MNLQVEGMKEPWLLSAGCACSHESYARLPSRVSKANVFVVAVDFFRAMCDTEVSPKNPKSGPNVGLRSSPLMV